MDEEITLTLPQAAIENNQQIMLFFNRYIIIILTKQCSPSAVTVRICDGYESSEFQKPYSIRS